MRDHSLLLFTVIMFGYIAGYCVAQSQTEESHQQPIGAYRVYQKTHFQCAGRPSGYYADVETGCQVYHMCDGLGRQFSYSCPNTTLFQQRMLICDHWYMVNCSRAESNYDANLLIGQRDKPFVTDQENELRTPRPDLLDRPYAADYAGESFRNQYTLTQASPNSLDADVDSTPIKPFVRPNQPYTFATHWSTQHPSKVQSTVNPPPLTPFVLSNDLLPPLQQTLPSNNHQADAVDGSAAQFAHNHDLALSSSQDSRRSEPETNFINAIPTVKTEVKKPLVHFTPPHAQPQYNINYAQVTQQQLPSTATATAFTQTLTESTTAESSQPTTDDVTDRTPQPFVARKPSASGNHRGHTKFNQPNSGNKANAPAAKFSLGETGRILSRPSNELATDHRPSSAAAQEPVRIPSPPPSDLLPPFDKVQIYDDATTQGPPIYSQWKIPSSGLLPPLLHAKLSRANSPPDNQLNVGGGAAAVKPPKSVPANSVPISALKRPAIGLQPPRFEAPATEAPSVQLFQNSQHNLFRKSNLVQTTPSFPLPTTEPTTTTSINLIPAETPSFAQHNHHHKSPTPRSVPPTSNAAAATASSGANVATNHLHTRDNHYLELKKLLHIPDYTFPLEADTQARGHYVRGDSVNSFQVRIPVGVNDVTDDDGGAATAPTTASPTGTTLGAAVAVTTTTTGGGDDGGTAGTTVRTRRAPWYGENAACPECHPSFVKAGSCEPCVKIRR